MKKNHLKLLQRPGNSPDMNPIESLEDILKDEIHKNLCNQQNSDYRTFDSYLVSLWKNYGLVCFIN